MLVLIAIHALETIFVIGMLGCVVVVTLTTLEDIRVLLGKDDHATKQDDAQAAFTNAGGTAITQSTAHR